MRRRHNQSKNTVILLLFLVLIGIGIAYAVLTETLTINNTVSYDAMKWDVGFTSAEDGWETYVNTIIKNEVESSGTTLEEQGMTREEIESSLLPDFIEYAFSTATISPDKKSIDVNCNLIMTSKSQVCMVKATITNDSTFNIAFNESPLFIYENAYILNSAVVWVDHELYGVFSQVSKGQTLAAGETADVFIAIMTTELTEDMLPQTVMSIPITVELSFEEVDYLMQDLSILMSENSSYAFWIDTYRSKVKSITFEDEINISDNVVESWDISVAQDGRIMSYVVPNSSDSTYYDLYIQSNKKKIYANYNMSSWFENFTNLDSIKGLELLDTRFTTNMRYMFEDTGFNSEIFTLDVSNFDTSNVTDMAWMFNGAGYNSTIFTLDVSNFGTSKVTNMYGMFFDTGHNSTVFTLDVSNFDTSNVTNMGLMFDGAGYNSIEFDLDLEGFDTSKVEYMDWMLWNAGYNSTKFITDITIKNPNVLSYDHMFRGVATKTGSKITVNYTGETSDLVDRMIATKSENSNVVKGIQVD